MTVRYLVVMVLAISSSILRADLTVKIRTIAGTGQTTETTEYYKGNLMRRDFGPGYQVVDVSTGRSFSVDPGKKEYYPFDGAKMVMKRVIDPSHKIFIEVSCSATGEQREWFGYPSRRYLTTKKFHDEFKGKSSEVHETHLDTWVLDFPVPPHVQGIASPNANFFLAGGLEGGVMKLPDVKATHSGPQPRGLVVWLKSDQYESEVVALSVAPLDENLFDVPKGFGEVTRPTFGHPLSWRDQIELEWLGFRAWIYSLFGS
jgi:hypothetical protein